ncbi:MULTISPECIES: hypothetical protein [Roseomonadaceae]|uniref:Uncharacterized protein n=1 Tax=Falsiroseomonas oleicola TaxID=2801474 RepID=A0ABS6H5K4_9PROT|nr:hypothetical protein [Roseomonas oleicola]MBU8543964.1 hypothetical protein [Roseomonas oleicola]
MPNPSPIHGDARAARVIQQARELRAASEPLARAFLAGLRAAEQACRDRADTHYEASDRAAGTTRAAENQRAAEAIACAERLLDLSITAARATGQPLAGKRSIRTLLARLTGAK